MTYCVSPALVLLISDWVLPVSTLGRGTTSSGSASSGSVSGVATISIVGTTDLHGRVFADAGRGGLALLGGYLAHLRAARQADGGAVLLLDAGDAFQGGMESDLSEGAIVVDAYNALGYTAAAIGNHEFEYGAVDVWESEHTQPGDPRGALKARAAQARFPMLAANLLDASTGRRVEWPNVGASTLVEAAGVKVGIVGAMTFDALTKTLGANVGGLSVAPLTDAIRTEASALRSAGAQLVVVVAHAGGDCAGLDDPNDLSSCDAEAEIFDVVRRLPPGLVDVVVAGHTHAAVAHHVAGVAIVQAFSWGRAFSRVDVTVDRATGRVGPVRMFEPRQVCAQADASGHCDAQSSGTPLGPARYEGRPVEPDRAVTAAMAPALQRVRTLRATLVGPLLDSPIPRVAGDESAIGNLFADALLGMTPGTDAAISYSTGPGGLRADLPAGPLRMGPLYDVFPFDNRVVGLHVTGAQLRQVIAAQLRRPRGRASALGVAGIRVQVACAGGGFRVHVSRASGHPIADDERLAITTTDFLAARAASISPTDVATTGAAHLPLLRDVVARWLQRRGGRLRQEHFADPARPRWQYVGTGTDERCPQA